MKRLAKRFARLISGDGQQKSSHRIAKLEERNRAFSRSLKNLSHQYRGVISLLETVYVERLNSDPTLTAQERAWAGKHGFRYVIAHLAEDWKATRVPFWRVILGLTKNVTSVCEFGSNIGANLNAIRLINPDVALTGIEISPPACDVLRGQGIAAVHRGSIIDCDLNQEFDLVFSRGVLIHLNPDELTKTFHNMAKHSRRYVLVYEIYSPEPFHLSDYSAVVEVTAGERSEGYQFWRDFPGEFARLYPDWSRVGSGVMDNLGVEPKHGDIYWVLFERPGL